MGLKNIKLSSQYSSNFIYIIKAHSNKFDESIWDSIFIPNYFYLATAGADSVIKLFKL